MGFLDTAEEKAEAFARKEAIKVAEIKGKKERREKEQDILAYEMGVNIKDRDVFKRWVSKNMASPTIALVMTALIGAVIGFLLGKVM
jgi:hypothetical protein